MREMAHFCRCHGAHSTQDSCTDNSWERKCVSCITVCTTCNIKYKLFPDVQYAENSVAARSYIIQIQPVINSGNIKAVV